MEEIELIIVDDASTDGTAEVLRQQVATLADQIIYHPKNRGKGAALRSGFAVATGEIVIVQDADLEYNPAGYPSLIDPISSGQADVVFGSRFVGGAPHRVVYFWHMVGNKLLTLFSNMCTNLNLTDMESGYKAFRRSILAESVSVRRPVRLRARDHREGCPDAVPDLRSWHLLPWPHLRRREKKSRGAMASAPFTRFSNTTFWWEETCPRE